MAAALRTQILYDRETCFLGDSMQAEISAADTPPSAGYYSICTSLGITSEPWEVEKETTHRDFPSLPGLRAAAPQSSVTVQMLLLLSPTGGDFHLNLAQGC